jgi:hypothetical protein
LIVLEHGPSILLVAWISQAKTLKGIGIRQFKQAWHHGSSGVLTPKLPPPQCADEVWSWASLMTVIWFGSACLSGLA